MGTGCFPGVNSGWGVALTPHPTPSSAVVMNGQSYTSTPMGRTACTEPQFLYKVSLYLTSVPVYVSNLPLHYLHYSSQLTSGYLRTTYILQSFFSVRVKLVDVRVVNKTGKLRKQVINL